LAASLGVSLVVTVFVRVVLAGFFGVMHRVHMMAVRHMGVVPRLFVIAGFVMLSSREMVFRGVTVMLGGFPVMIRNLF
jgi:hypothetical protein